MAPPLYRIILQVDNLDKAEGFYGKLLADRGRRIPRGSRHYIDCGPVILALVDVNGEGIQPKPLPDTSTSPSTTSKQSTGARSSCNVYRLRMYTARAAVISSNVRGASARSTLTTRGEMGFVVDENTVFTGK